MIDEPDLENYETMEEFQEKLIETYGDENLELIDSLFVANGNPISEADSSVYAVMKRLGIKDQED